MRLAIVIAAYNEATSIAETVKSIPAHIEGVSSHDVIVINDGSSDKTEECALGAGAIVLSHPINRGQGAALETGLEFARRNAYDLVVTFDADGQHLGEEISRIIAPIIAKKADVALGSRFLEGAKTENLPGARKAVLKAGIMFTRVVSRIKVTDTHNGFRAFSSRALELIKIRQDRMEHASEILDLITRHKVSYVEVPVTIRYTEYSNKKGQANSNALRIAVRMLLYKISR